MIEKFFSGIVIGTLPGVRHIYINTQSLIFRRKKSLNSLLHLKTFGTFSRTGTFIYTYTKYRNMKHLMQIDLVCRKKYAKSTHRLEIFDKLNAQCELGQVHPQVFSLP